ncbi:hypothetical protein [Roseateles sp.]|uniref:NHL domain-containing protein n=1 Tax=Roseateles sp. TaxID=1971397 RepID=UPI003D143285
MNYPHDAVEGSDGAIYISETSSHAIRKVVNGKIELFAGTLSAGHNGDGNRLTTALNSPTGLSILNNELYFADTGNYLIRSIDLQTGVIKTVAGIPGKIGWPNISQETNKTNIGYSVWIGHDSTGALWAAMNSRTPGELPRLYRVPAGYKSWYQFDLPNYIPANVIKSVRPVPGVGVDLMIDNMFYRLTSQSASSRRLSTLFGGGIHYDQQSQVTYIGDHTTILAIDKDGRDVGRLPVSFANTVSIKPSAQGGMLVVDSDQGRVYKLTNQGAISWSTGGDATALGVIVSLAKHKGKILALDNNRPSVISINPDGSAASRTAGNGILGWASINVAGTSTSFYYPGAIALDSKGHTYIAEQNRIMKIDAASQTVSLFCGYERAGNVHGVDCKTARFQAIRGLAFDAADNLFVADTYNNQVKKISSDGSLVTLVAGSGAGRTSTELLPKFDTAATASPLNHPHAVRVSAGGDLYIADSWNNAIYKIGATGRLQLIAGTPGRATKWTSSNAPYQDQGEYSGDGGEATKAKMNTPSGLSFCPNGDLLVADEFNFAVRRIDTSGVITTVFGGQNGYAANGSKSGYIHDVLCDETGFYAADVGNALVYRVKTAK